MRSICLDDGRRVVQGFLSECRGGVASSQYVFSRDGSMIASTSISIIASLCPSLEIWISTLAGRLFVKNLNRSSDTR